MSDPRLLEWARRRASGLPPVNAIESMRAGATREEVIARHGLPAAAADGVRSFYDQIEPGPRICDGTACHFGGAELLAARLDGAGPLKVTRCLGHCYAAPSFQSGASVFARPLYDTVASWLEDWGESGQPLEDLSEIPRRALVDPPVVLRRLVPGARRDRDAEYDLPDGETILAAIEASGLRGRGGAVYPTGAKWRAARDTPAADRFVVANGDEGDPGSFVDRLLLEEDPHAILAGMVACARAIGASRGVVYVRAEYPRAQRTMLAAIEEARRSGHLGHGFDVELHSGAGSYLCGEETALIRSIEGLRGEPWPKPPYPSQSGLFGLPTVVQNVETLAIVPWVVRTGRGTGTKAVSLSGAIAHPGVVEIPLGMPLARVLEEAGGGAPPGRRWKMALVGGPMGRVLPVSRFDTPLAFDALPGLGHAGVVVLDETVSVRALAEHLFEFARAESCGSCAPCRIGTARLAAMRDRFALERLLETLETGSLCGFGMGVPRPIRDLLEHFGDEALP